MERDIKVSITLSTVLKGFLVAVLLYFLYFIRDLVLVVLTSVVIASAIEPMTVWFSKYKIKRLLATVIIYICILVIMMGILIFFVPILAEDAVLYLNNIPESVSIGDLWSPIKDSSLGSQSFSVKEIVQELRSVVANDDGEGVFKTASAIFGGALSFVLIVILSFYLSVQKDGVTNFLKLISPINLHEYIINLWYRSRRKIGYWMQGQLLLGFLVGVFVYLGLMILGVQHALLLAVLAGLFEVIPVFGPILSAIPAVTIALSDGGATMAILVIGLYVIIQQFENHLLYPLVVQKIVGVSPIVVILALVIGAKLAGFLGAILSVPMSAVLMEYVSDIERRRKEENQKTNG